MKNTTTENFKHGIAKPFNVSGQLKDSITPVRQ